MTRGNLFAMDVIRDLQPTVTKEILKELVRKEKIDEQAMIKTFADYDIIRIRDVPKNKENSNAIR